MSELAWFAPDADLTRMVRLGVGTGAGLDSVPTDSGGDRLDRRLAHAGVRDPVTGQVLARAPPSPPTGGLVSDYGNVTITDGRAYAYYQDQRARKAGVAILSPARRLLK